LHQKKRESLDLDMKDKKNINIKWNRKKTKPNMEEKYWWPRKLCTTLANSKWKRKLCLKSNEKQEHQKERRQGWSRSLQSLEGRLPKSC
jgi:hypothetical protein